MELRKGLGDDPREPSYVRTIHRFGYAFCGPPPESAAAGDAPGLSEFSLVEGSREVPLHQGENLLGRTPEAVVRLGSTKASRHHARIVVSGARAVLEDLGSKNGTFLNKRRVEGSMAIAGGDRIVVGRELLVVNVGSPQGSTETDVEQGQAGRPCRGPKRGLSAASRQVRDEVAGSTSSAEALEDVDPNRPAERRLEDRLVRAAGALAVEVVGVRRAVLDDRAVAA
jgi:hypothetical protein